jgi:hypothetical protein
MPLALAFELDALAWPGMPIIVGADPDVCALLVAPQQKGWQSQALAYRNAIADMLSTPIDEITAERPTENPPQ